MNHVFSSVPIYITTAANETWCSVW